MKKSIWWLFLIPLLLPLLIMGIQRRQNAQLSNYFVSRYKSEIASERAAVKKLAQVLAEGHDKGRIRVMWNDVKPALKPTPQRSTEVWLYGIIYDQQDKRLTRYLASPHFTNASRVEAIQYDNVTNTVVQLAAQNNATSSQLVKYGATLMNQGEATFIDEFGPVFQ